jgi:hypothetical protein
MSTQAVRTWATRFDSFRHATKMQLPGVSDTRPDEVHLDAAIEWLCRSCDETPGDGSAATYNLVLGWEDPYPETTGYIVPTLYTYADRTDRPELADRATSMADWLLSTQLPCGGFPEGTGTGGDPNVFNTGQIVLGLTAAYRRTGEERFRDATRRACDWLVETQDPAGSWSQHDYRGTTHVYTTRVAWALLEAATIRSESQVAYMDAAAANLEWVRSHRRENGWFEHAGFDQGDTPYLHTIAYTIRGMLEASQHLGDDEMFEAARDSADTLLALQQSDGVLKGEYDADWSPGWYYCLPGNAQMGLVWIRLHQLTGAEEYLLAARNTAEFLKYRQPLTGPPQVRGGIPGSYPYLGRYIFFRYPNWGAKFFADLLLALNEETPPRTADGGHSGDAQGSGESVDSVCRVCLLVDGEYVQQWVAESIERMVTETNAELSLVVSNEDAGLLGTGTVRRGLKYPAYAGYWALSKLKSRAADSTAYDDAVHISEISGVSEASWIRTYPANVDGLWSELPDEVTETVSETSDVVVRRGFGLLRGEILTATEYGVLSYHHGDPREYRGGPAGFWEFMHDVPTAGMMVQTLQEDLDAGTVEAYDEVDISDCRSWGEVQERLYPNSTHLLAEAIENVQNPGIESLDIDEFGPVYHPPSAGELGSYLVKRVSENLSLPVTSRG